VQASGLSDITAISSGWYHGLALAGALVSQTTTYSYDKLYRLTAVDAPGSGLDTSYSYDPAGNRLSMIRINSTSYSYDRADRITAAGSVSYTVNANGNLTARGSDSFAYDQANRLTSITISGATSTYVYDGDGKRASTTAGGLTTSYVMVLNN
jgi:YD repeat-containing protein